MVAVTVAKAAIVLTRGLAHKDAMLFMGRISS
jgi:hypothetical protein